MIMKLKMIEEVEKEDENELQENMILEEDDLRDIEF